MIAAAVLLSPACEEPIVFGPTEFRIELRNRTDEQARFLVDGTTLFVRPRDDFQIQRDVPAGTRFVFGIDSETVAAPQIVCVVEEPFQRTLVRVVQWDGLTLRCVNW